MGETRGLYEQFDIDPRYDDPGNYGPAGSHFGDGRYPPDWEQRRDAIWWLQDHDCARCGRSKYHASGYEVHHIRHLDNGGRNDLDNLAGLCSDCHALMHPDLDWMDGSVRRSPIFPAADAEDDVAVVRWPTDADEKTEALGVDLSRLAKLSDSAGDRPAVTDAAVPTDPAIARHAGIDLQNLLAEAGYVARSEPHHAIHVEPAYRGLIGPFVRFEPGIAFHADADLIEHYGWTDGNCPTTTIRCSEDARKARLDLDNGVGDVVTERLDLEATGEREIAVPLKAPPLSAKTAPGYLAGFGSRFGRKVLFRGVPFAALVGLAAGEYVPLDGSWAGGALLAVLCGFLLTAFLAVKSAVAGRLSSSEAGDDGRAPSLDLNECNTLVEESSLRRADG
jgi:hypothetical protein